MFDLPTRLTGGRETTEETCGCEVSRVGATLVVDASDCAAGADLKSAPACRATVVANLETRGADVLRCVDTGRERTFLDSGVDLFASAGRFASAARERDDRLARLARRDPLRAAREAADRADSLAAAAEDADFARFAGHDEYDGLLSPLVGPQFSSWRVDPAPPAAATLVATRQVASGATVRIYERPDRETRVYHLEPAARRFDGTAMATLDAAHEYLASAPLDGERAPERAVRAVASEDVPAQAVSRALRKHVRDGGLLRDLFADPALSDVYVTAPADRNAIRVRVDGETLETNVVLTADGVATLASRFRRESGRGFSRAQPTLDAATTVGDRRVRVAGVTDPVSDGEGFALRAHDRTAWTLPGLVANGTISAEAAGLLSVAVERGSAVLLAGPRGSGKTTTLGSLLWELPGDVRTVLIEDAPELPVEALQEAGRDVQALRATADDALAPVEALRAALRLGDGALVVGEVRGEEAGVLYEAMRVGANSEAVLGTIHGDGGEAVLERVVSDLGVPASAFATTDLVVSQAVVGTGQQRSHRVNTIEEVVDGESVGFAPLYEQGAAGLEATGRVDRGNSRLVAALTGPESTYSETRQAIARRAAWVEDLAASGKTEPEAVTTAQVTRER